VIKQSQLGGPTLGAAYSSAEFHGNALVIADLASPLNGAVMSDFAIHVLEAFFNWYCGIFSIGTKCYNPIILPVFINSKFGFIYCATFYASLAIISYFIFILTIDRPRNATNYGAPSNKFVCRSLFSILRSFILFGSASGAAWYYFQVRIPGVSFHENELALFVGMLAVAFTVEGLYRFLKAKKRISSYFRWYSENAEVLLHDREMAKGRALLPLSVMTTLVGTPVLFIIFAPLVIGGFLAVIIFFFMAKKAPSAISDGLHDGAQSVTPTFSPASYGFGSYQDGKELYRKGEPLPAFTDPDSDLARGYQDK